MEQAISQQIKWDFKANGELEIKDKNGNIIYYENSLGFWAKYEYDSQNNRIYSEHSTGMWMKKGYDSEGKTIYIEDQDGTIIVNGEFKTNQLKSNKTIIDTEAIKVITRKELHSKIKKLGDFGFTADSIEFGPLLITCWTQNKRGTPHYYVYGKNDKSENGIFNSASIEKIVGFVFNKLGVYNR
jgi:hypothetical protein